MNTRCRLVLIILDPQRFRKAISILKPRGVDYSIPKYTEYRGRPNDIVYTDSQAVAERLQSRVRTIILDRYGKRMLLEKAILKLYNKDMYNELTIGIDPGRRYTAVAIADGEIIDWIQSTSEKELLSFIKENIEEIPAKKKVIKVGTGYRGLDLITKITTKGAIIEAVDEGGSTPHGVSPSPFIERLIRNIDLYTKNITRKKDLYAAIAIALKEGVVVEAGDEAGDKG